MEYDKHVEAARNLTALKDNLFGDNVSLYNGATEFTQVDIDIPGNNALPVQLVRRLSIDVIPSGIAGESNSNLLGAGNWDIDVPYISGTYISGGGGRLTVVLSVLPHLQQGLSPPISGTAIRSIFPEAAIDRCCESNRKRHGLRMASPTNGPRVSGMRFPA